MTPSCPDLALELWIPWRLGARSVDPYLDTLYSAFEMIESGVTTVQHINSLFFGALELPAADQFHLFEDLHGRHNGDPLTRIQLAPGNLHWTSDQLLDRFADYSMRFDVPMHMHLVETPYQKEYARGQCHVAPG